MTPPEPAIEASKAAPSPSGDHGPDGRFATGNKAAVGNPHAGRVAKLRAVMLGAVTDEDMLAVTRKLIELAKGGDMPAIRTLLERTLGRVELADAADASLEASDALLTRAREMIDRARAWRRP